MATSTAARSERHLRLVGPSTDDGHADPTPAPPSDDGLSAALWHAGFDVSVPPEPSGDRRWLACERPDARLCWGAYLCSCRRCVDALRKAVNAQRHPNATVVIVTDVDRIVTTARELLAQLDAGRGFEAFLWLDRDRVRYVYVGRGSAPGTVSAAHLAWRGARSRRVHSGHDGPARPDDLARRRLGLRHRDRSRPDR